MKKPNLKIRAKLSRKPQISPILEDKLKAEAKAKVEAVAKLAAEAKAEVEANARAFNAKLKAEREALAAILP